MLEVKGNNIKLTRGDTAFLTIPINDTVADEAYEIRETDILTLSVKKNVNAKEYLFQKVIQGGNVFKIEPSDTKNLRYGTYIYDVQLNIGDDVFTIIKPSNFEVTTEVTI